MPTRDWNAQVFQTVEQTTGQRRQQLIRHWTDMAVADVGDERPDLKAQAGQDLSITIEADGIHQTVDLSPLRDSFLADVQGADQLLREHLRKQLVSFDQRRMAGMGLDTLRPRIQPMLIGGKDVDLANSALAYLGPIQAIPVAADLYWALAVRWDGGAIAPIGLKALAAWNASPGDVEAIAMANLRRQIDGGISFQTERFGPDGVVGNLTPAANPAIILLPEFASHVRQAWQTDDQIVLLLTSTRVIRFIESRNKRLLDLLYPQWQRDLENVEHPLCGKPLLVGAAGIEVFKYDPPVAIHALATRPATRPAMPKPYIAR